MSEYGFRFERMECGIPVTGASLDVEIARDGRIRYVLLTDVHAERFGSLPAVRSPAQAAALLRRLEHQPRFELHLDREHLAYSLPAGVASGTIGPRLVAEVTHVSPSGFPSTKLSAVDLTDPTPTKIRLAP